MSDLLVLVSLMGAVVVSFVAVAVGASLVSPYQFVGVEHPHHVEVAEEAEDGGGEHVGGLFHHFLVDYPGGSFEEQLERHHPDNPHAYECPQRLELLVAEGQMLGGDLVAHEDCREGDHVAGDIREEVEGVGEDGDGVGVVAPRDLYEHEDEGGDGYLFELEDDGLVFRVHCWVEIVEYYELPSYASIFK